MARTVREASVYPICMREFDVLRVTDVTPGMRRVVVGGPAIREHVRDGVVVPPVRSHGFDDDIKILPPDQAGGLPFAVPRNTDTGAVDWPAGSFEYSRTYTVRAFDAEAGELTIDFALHQTGLASTWARRVHPGAKILIAGPKHSAGLPTAADWMLIGGDETALPAIAHCLELLPSSLPATVIIEVAEPSHRQELTSSAEVDITWVYRSENDGASTLAATLQAAPWRPGQPYLWVAGEANVIKPVRRWAKHDREIPKEFVEIAGYWRRREVATVPGDPELVDAAASDNYLDRIREQSELLPPFALRAAVTLGVFGEIDAGASSAVEVAAACGSDVGATEKLLRHLVLMELLTADSPSAAHGPSGGVRYGLTEAGRHLAEPDSLLVASLHLDGTATALDLSFAGLLEAVRTGEPVGVGGQPFSERIRDPDFAAKYHDDLAREASYRAPALNDALRAVNVDVGALDSIALIGEGGGVFADVLLRQFPHLSVALIGLPSVTRRMLADVAAARLGSVTEIATAVGAPLADPVDLIVAVDVVDTHPDEDTVAILAALAASARRVAVVADLLDPATTDDHQTEDDLRRLCVYGSGKRSESELRRLVEAAGGTDIAAHALGWGANMVVFDGVTH